jgi:helicase
VDALRIDGKRLLSALKMALIIRAWTRTSDVSYVAHQCGCYPFEIVRLRESVERLLLAMCAIREPPDDADEPQELQSDNAVLHERARALYTMVAAGIDERAVTLASVSGIGPILARRLQEAGIIDLQHLAGLQPVDLSGLPGISRRRATIWITQACDLVSTSSMPSFDVDAPAPTLRAADAQAVDPYRLRRACDLRVYGPDGDTYRVTGGLEPHRVHMEGGTPVCDCHDADEGHICKHVLAIRLHRGDRELRRLVKQLTAGPTADGPLSLFDLWYGDHTATRARRTRWNRDPERSARHAARSSSPRTSRLRLSAKGIRSTI